MPRGTRHIVTGLLLPGIQHLYFLEVQGGVWQIDISRGNDRFIVMANALLKADRLWEESMP